LDFFEAVKKRYSYRGEFSEQEIPRKDLIKIVQSGLDAPSGKNLQTTEFVIVDDINILSKIKIILPDSKVLQTCKALIICIIDSEPEKIYHGTHFQIEDCSAAVENILLAITAMNYASVWLDGVLRIDGRANKIGEIIGLPKSKKVQIILPVGIPTETTIRREKKTFNERVGFNIYNFE